MGKTDDSIICNVSDDDIFPPFHSFIANPKLYYCYLQFIYNYDVDGGVLPDNETIIFNENQRLHVPIDNDTIYLENGEMKSKDTHLNLDNRTVKLNNDLKVSVPIDEDTIYVDANGKVKSKPGQSIPPDNSTIVINDEDKLSVPIDNDTIYVQGGKVKAKESEGHAYTSNSLNVDNTNDTINLNNPALDTTQVKVSDEFEAEDHRLDYWMGAVDVAVLKIDGKVDDVTCISDDPSLLTITKTTLPEAPHSPIFNFDIGQISYTDLSQLRTGQVVQTIIFGNPPSIIPDAAITFKEGDTINMVSGGNIGIGGTILVYGNNTVGPDRTTATYSWVGATRTLTLIPSGEVTGITGAIPTGVGEYILTQPDVGLQDVIIGSSDNTITVGKTTPTPGVLNFNLQAVGGGTATDVESSTLEVDKVDNVTNINIKPFDPAKAYAQGKLVTYDNMLHMSSGSTAGAWTPSQWINLSYFPTYQSSVPLGILNEAISIDYSDLNQMPGFPGNTSYPLSSLVYDGTGKIGIITATNSSTSKATVSTIVAGGGSGGGTAYTLLNQTLATTPNSNTVVQRANIRNWDTSTTATDFKKGDLIYDSNGTIGLIPADYDASVSTYSVKTITAIGNTGTGFAYVADIVEAETKAMAVFDD